MQLAKAFGVRVISLSRSKQKAERLMQLGVSDVIDSTEHPNWEEQVRALTGGKGSDVTIEVIGGSSLQHSIAAAAFEGRIDVIGFIEDMMSTVAIPWRLGTNVALQGTSVGSRKDFTDLLAFMEQHKIEPLIEATYTLQQLQQVFDHFDKSPFGKIVVKVS